MFPNPVANDYKLHVVVNGVVTFWLISTSESSIKVILFNHVQLIDNYKVTIGNMLVQLYGNLMVTQRKHCCVLDGNYSIIVLLLRNC